MADYVLQMPETRKTRLLAAMSYLAILCLFPLVFGENNEFIRFHARQGLILWAWTLLSIFALTLGEIGGFFLTFSMGVIGLYSLIGLVAVFLNRNWRLPVIAVLAEKL
ncbi:MAG: hypothetical protein HQL90_06655 [Magnetococcales bacterium]|nr:hypothetical protein [Magnetococcales bacterium]